MGLVELETVTNSKVRAMKNQQVTKEKFNTLEDQDNQGAQGQQENQNKTPENTSKNIPAEEDKPDPETQNDTGFQGTTNSLSENRQDDQDGYKIAIEDTMIDYDGSDEDQMNMDLGDGNVDTENTRGVDDND